MKFADLEFHASRNGFGVQAHAEFPNGYTASIVKSQYSYGGSEGKYEIAVCRGNEIVYNTPVTNDVLGHLNESDVTSALDAIEKLPAVQP